MTSNQRFVRRDQSEGGRIVNAERSVRKCSLALSKLAERLKALDFGVDDKPRDSKENRNDGR